MKIINNIDLPTELSDRTYYVAGVLVSLLQGEYDNLYPLTPERELQKLHEEVDRLIALGFNHSRPRKYQVRLEKF